MCSIILKKKKMVSIKKIVIAAVLFWGLLFSAIVSNSQVPDSQVPNLQVSDSQVPGDIIAGFETGNVKILSRYFNQNVNLVVLDNNNVYSKAQTQQIVGDFFNTHLPDPEKGFSLIHEINGKDGSKSVIGNIETKKGEIFRIYFLLKQNEAKEYIIHQLRFEKQE